MFLKSKPSFGFIGKALHTIDKTKCCPGYLTISPLFFIFAFAIVPVLFIDQAHATTTLTTSQFSDPSLLDRTHASNLLSSTSVANGVTLSSSVLETTAGHVRVNTLDVDLSNSHVHLVHSHQR
jgi:hypothetical protein